MGGSGARDMGHISLSDVGVMSFFAPSALPAVFIQSFFKKKKKEKEKKKKRRGV